MLMFVLGAALILAIFGSLPEWPNDRTDRSYLPKGGISFVIVVCLILFILRW